MVKKIYNGAKRIKLIDINKTPVFTLDKDRAGFVSFDVSHISHLDKHYIVLSLFLQDAQSVETNSEFILYSVDVKTGKINERGLAVLVKTKIGSFVDFNLPVELFEGGGKIGVVLSPNSDGNLTFIGNDLSVNSPRLTIEHEDEYEVQAKKKVKQIDLTSVEDYKGIVDIQSLRPALHKLLKNTAPKWWENHWVQAFMLLGAIAGVVGLILFFQSK